MTSRQAGTMALAASAVIWGFAFVAQRAGMAYVGPFTFNGLRFALGGLALIPIYIASQARVASPTAQRIPTQDWWVIGLAGIVLFAAANLQQAGLVYTTAGKAGFITGLYVVIVPILGLLARQRVRGPVWIGCALAVAGLYLLSVVGPLSISVGDGLVLASAFGWAIHVQLVGWLARRVAPLRIAIVQFLTCAILSLLVAFVKETISWPAIEDAGWMIAYAGILSVAVAYTLQVVGQRQVDPSRAGVILSLEVVFALIGGWVILGERLSTRGLVGCALMLGGMILAQLRFNRQSDVADDVSTA